MNPPNILILMTDQQRFDALGCAHHSLIQTPNLDRLAASGVHFTRAVTPTPVCVAARLSFITGHRISRHRHPANGALPGPLPEFPTLMSLLSQKGYWTQGIGKMHFKGRHFGFHDIQSMEECPRHRVDDDYLNYLHSHGIKSRFPHGIRDLLFYQPQTSGVPLEHAPNTWVANQSVEFIRRHCEHRPEQPFFLWSSWISPHPPFAPCEPYDRLYDPGDMALPIFADRPIHDIPPSLLGHRARLDGAHRDPDRIRRIRALYYGLISHVDAGIGAILDELDAQGIADNTVVLFVSDHGDMLGDHGLSQKNCPYEPSVRIPFILRWPGKTDPGRINEDLVSLLDVFPTCIDALGLLHANRESLTGENLLGKPGGGLLQKRDAQIIDYGHGIHRWLCVRTQSHKYAWFAQGGVEELYDLENDPHEMQNIAANEPALIRQFRHQALAWEKQHGFPETLNGDQFTTHPPPDRIPLENDCRTVSLNTGSWPKRLPASQRDTVETFAVAFDRAVHSETTLSPEKLSIDMYNQQLEKCDPLSHGSEELGGTAWEENK
jgi:arylsulfatase A-like enzyme